MFISRWYPNLRSDKVQKTYAYYLSFIALGIVGAAIGPTLQDLRANTGSSEAAFGVVFILAAVGYMVGAYMVGHLYDMFRGHPLIIFGLVAVAGLYVVIPLVRSLWLMALVVFLVGLVESFIDVGGNTLMVWVHRTGVGRYINALHFFYGLGALLAPLVIAVIIGLTDSVQYAFWALAALMLVPTLFLIPLSSPIDLKRATAEQDAPPDKPVDYRLVAILFMMFFLYVGIEVSMGSWIFSYAFRLDILDEQASRYLNSAFWGALTFGRLLSIPMATRWTPRAILNFDFGLILLSLVLLTWRQDAISVWLGVMLAGFGMAAVFPTFLAYAEKRITITGRVNSLFFVAAGLGSMFLPWGVGVAFDALGPESMMGLLLGGMALMMGGYAVLLVYSWRVYGE